MAYFSKEDPENVERMGSFMGPGGVDQMIRQAIQIAWMMLPDERKNVDEVERVIHHTVDRDREDAELFDKGR
jgi:hypothetical protein